MGAPAPATPDLGGAQAAAPAWPSLPEQLLPQTAALRTLGDGTHRITVRLDPENLGPVRVVADVADGSLRVQLHAMTEVGRDALRQALPDLRRDLAATGSPGTTTSVDLGSGAGSSGNGGGAAAGWGGPGTQDGTGRQATDLARSWAGRGTTGSGQAPDVPMTTRTHPTAPPGRLDLMV